MKISNLPQLVLSFLKENACGYANRIKIDSISTRLCIPDYLVRLTISRLIKNGYLIVRLRGDVVCVPEKFDENTNIEVSSMIQRLTYA